MVGSDKERPKGRVGSGSDNARGSPILRYTYIIYDVKKLLPYYDYYYFLSGLVL